jgi:hypothetical protein
LLFKIKKIKKISFKKNNLKKMFNTTLKAIGYFYKKKNDKKSKRKSWYNNKSNRFTFESPYLLRLKNFFLKKKRALSFKRLRIKKSRKYRNSFLKKKKFYLNFKKENFRKIKIRKKKNKFF